MTMRRARVALVAVGLAWSLFVCLPAYGLETFVITLGCALAPHLALAAVARWLRLTVLVGAAVVVLGVNVATWLSVRSSDSSTAPVAMLLAPILIAVVVLSIALLASSVKALRGDARAE